MLTGQLALIAAALFAGAAFYITIAEHPARMALDDGSALAQWKPAYQRGYAMQASLAVVGFVFGLLAWWQTGRSLWLAGALVLIANWPFTLFAIMPVNNRLKISEAGAQSRALLERWGTLHAVRTALGIASMLIFLWASLN